MTAPGPQQPDEVLLDLIARRILNTVDPTDDGATVRMRCVELVRSGGVLPAAPSAQPDDYELLRDTIIDKLNPPDDDAAEVAILDRAVEQAAAYIERQPCQCSGDAELESDPCDRCRVLGRINDERQER